MDIITHNRNKKYKNSTIGTKTAPSSEEDDIELQVSGSESNSAPLVTTGDEDLDPDIIDMLYTKPRHKPLDGFGASSWDSDY